MKRKNFRLDKVCLDWLDTFDGRRGEHGKAEMVRCGVTLAAALESESSASFLCELARLIRNGRTDEALDALHNRLTDAAGSGAGAGASPVDRGDSAPPGSGDVGDDEDDVGGDLPAIPGMEGDEGMESAQAPPKQASEGDPESEAGPDSGEGNQDTHGGIGSGVISKALGLNR